MKKINKKQKGKSPHRKPEIGTSLNKLGQHTHLTEVDCLLVFVPELRIIEENIVSVFIADKKTNKIIKSTKDQLIKLLIVQEL